MTTTCMRYAFKDSKTNIRTLGHITVASFTISRLTYLGISTFDKYIWTTFPFFLIFTMSTDIVE